MIKRFTLMLLLAWVLLRWFVRALQVALVAAGTGALLPVFTVVGVLVQGLVLVRLVQAGVDLLGRHAEVLGHHVAVRWGCQPVLEQQRVDRIIARQVPAVLHPVLAAGKVRQGAMQRFMRQHELGLRHLQ